MQILRTKGRDVYKRQKVELAVARGKKEYDKRHDIAKKDADRKMQQAMKRNR